MSSFCLDTIIIKPVLDIKPKNVVILFHGYGGDGNDIAVLANYWKRFLPETIFLCPNAQEKCTVNPSGFQWFDLSEDKENYIFEKSLNAEKKINQFVKEIINTYGINKKKICLSGFSQGCMMVLNVGLKSEQRFNCVVGFSGKIINRKRLINQIKSKPPIFLFHGDKDTIVPLTHLLEAKEFFTKINYKIKTKILKNCEHQIPVQASSLALHYIKKNLYI